MFQQQQAERDASMTWRLHFCHLAQEEDAGMWSVTRVPCPGWLEISTLPP
jgi:hypothetical protein